MPKFPASSRDIALLVRDQIAVGDIEAIIMSNGADIVEACKLFDVYKGDQIEKGYKSVAYSISYRSLEKTLTDDEIAPVHQSILDKLEKELDAKLRD